MSTFRAFLVSSLVLLVALAGLSLTAAAQPLPAIRPAGLDAASTQPDLRPAAIVPVAFLPFVPKMPVPEIPVLSPIAEPHGGAYRVEWTPSALATSYTLQEQAPGGLWATICSGPANFCDVGGRQAGTYSYRVKATNSSGDSAWSGVFSTMVISAIRGRVTNSGTPLGGVNLELRFWNGSGYSTAATTSTDGGGNYSFSPAPLAPGQSYYVRYPNGQIGNPRNPSYLSTGWSRDIVNFTGGTYIAGIDLDIANIVLSSPPHLATVGLPATFAWQPRSASPSDSYSWEIFQLSGPAYWDSPFLGYVSSYLLTSLPAGFGRGIQYGWAMWEQDAQGDGGASYYYRVVTFASGALAPAPGPGGAALPNPAAIERVEAAKAAARAAQR